MTAGCLLLPMLLTVAQGERKDPPLTEKQREQLVQLVRTTQERSADLKRNLDEKQQDLAKRYADFALDEAAVKKLQKEILDLQGELLANYHRLHVELRTIVGPERFATLRQRLDNILGLTPPKEKPRKQ